MGETRKNELAEDHDLVTALKALADVTRFRMIQEISEAGELSCGEVAERFDVSQPTISHHLKILLQAGLLVQRTEGKHHFTSVNQVLLGNVLAALPKRLRARAPKLADKKSRPTPKGARA